jgi:hypothetical protein
MRVALLEHDGRGASDHLARSLDASRIRPAELPDALLRLRKIGDAPGRMPGTLLALLQGDYELAHAFTAQDAVVAIAWSRLTGRPVVYTQSEPLTRANIADRRLRLAMLRRATEGADALVAPDERTAESLRRWMAAEARVLAPGARAEHLDLYASLHR